MSGAVAVLVAAGIIVLGGVGLYRVAFQQGFVEGVESCRDDEYVIKDEDE